MAAIGEFSRRALALPSRQSLYLLLAAALIALRIAAAVYLPLSFDEAYFWLWSKHLAVSYYDHPPLIALAIWAGTHVFGDGEFGVRAVSCAASIAASWAVWRAAALLLDSEEAGALACCFFNATLMIASQGAAAIPDSLVLGAAAFLLFAIAGLQRSANPRWWMAIAAALGAALLAKYTAFFLCAGVLLWFIATAQGRRWLRSPWPYAAALFALGCFLPNLLWNAAHGWVSFKFQFGRVVSGAPGLRYEFEFLGSQIALASPFILLLAIAGLAGETRAWRSAHPAAAAAALVWPGLVYFLFHALHDRVQGNWPSFTYPALCVLAAMAAQGARGGILKWSRMLALPAALVMLAAAYAQAFAGILPLGIGDPVARMTAVGFAPVARDVSALAARDRAKALVTSDYAATGWLSFYLKPHMPVLQISEDYRWLQAPRANLPLLRSPLVYVTRHPKADLPLMAAHFAKIEPLAVLARMRSGRTIENYYVYSLDGFHGPAIGRLPNAP